MGRASRRRSELRDAPDSPNEAIRRERRRADRAERRASRKGSSLVEYEEMAALDNRHVIEALIARHNKRMLNMAQLSGDSVRPVMSALVSQGLVDMSLRQLGATRDRFPASNLGPWVDHLAWGADSAFGAARLLFSGQYVGATAVLRSQFERWTENAAFSADVTHREGESSANFAARAWSSCHSNYPFAMQPDQMPSDGEIWDKDGCDSMASDLSVLVGEEYRVYPARLMNLMADLLHGRSPWVDAVRWEACDLLADQPAVVAEVADRLSDVMMLNLRQVRACLASLAVEQGKAELPRGLFSLPEMIYAGERPPPFDFLIPLIPQTGLHPEVVAKLAAAGTAYEKVMQGECPAGRLYRDDELVHLFFAERRDRASRWASRFLESEKRKMGNDFDLNSLGEREFRYIMAAEMAGLLATWHGNSPQGDAAAVCSSALRSAYWLWLEDDDRALAVLRIMLEQCARLRVWSTKPDRAEKLEASDSTTPKDWINAAGWRRLTALNRALGEFAHAHAKIRWEGAREILQKIQPDGHNEDAIHTARGHALDALTALLMAECVRGSGQLSSVMQGSFGILADDLYGQDGGLEVSLEDLLNRVFPLKSANLGEYSFQGPANERRNSGGG